MGNKTKIYCNAILLILSVSLLSSFLLKKERPRLFIIGDSTVKNGKGDGSNAQWGWGSIIGEFFQENEIEVQNKARGGTSSRTFYNNPKLWQQVLDSLRPGDFVMMQFGHNDTSPVVDTTRARGTFKGNDNKFEIVNNPLLGQKEVVYSYGFYLRRFVKNIQDKGAVAIICSPIPRDAWNGDKVVRNDYPKWAMQAAEQSGAFFIPLNALIIDVYEKEGEEHVSETYFGEVDHTHTTLAGAQLNARILKNFIAKNDVAGLARYLN
ncbi:rhamnogalacturonan acetylesterase [Sphingobacterium shayense]|uniref:rhamnogalacturonan acetylesterase n=1 Tax=Sphingobacterium shayense TaxID=626343 RepID=UPI0015535AC4|nr:rhamnogalacturonan acetylesterase [Sphingobacterium shayense]NQD70437.1 rhamnogalacturonan acetylesterase [Sphingobacterium shayense]